jgi:hypothetical protein
MDLFRGPVDRRNFLRAASIAGVGWLTPLGHLLARQAEQAGRADAAQSVILLWLAGGPSQLETFDPHPGKTIAGGTDAVNTPVKGLQLAEGMPQVAEQAGSIAFVRSVTSKEGDHERGTYEMKTGYRPDPTVVHPSIGAVCAHELPVGKTEIPRHISILPNRWPGRGGFLGDEFDAFKTYDPANKVPNVTAHVPGERDQRRTLYLDVVERAFAKGRENRVKMTRHRETVRDARVMMTSEQLKAFEVNREPERLRQAYGDSPFGRGCLAARRLIEVGVRCVEVTSDGWDTHANHHSLTKKLNATLDPAFATLVRDLRERDLLRRTIVICCGEFGRTPKINPAGGRDHWTNGFSIALAGGGLRAGFALGETDPEGVKPPPDAVTVAGIHATILTALGIDPKKTLQSPIGRTVQLSQGKAIKELLAT